MMRWIRNHTLLFLTVALPALGCSVYDTAHQPRVVVESSLAAEMLLEGSLSNQPTSNATATEATATENRYLELTENEGQARVVKVPGAKFLGIFPWALSCPMHVRVPSS